MSNLTERQRLVLTIAATVVLAGGLLVLIFKDRAEIDSTNDEIHALDSRISAAQVEIAKIKPREDKVLVYRAVEDRELQILPTKQQIANFHRDLSTFLARAGLTFQELPESTPTESTLAKGIFLTRTVLSCQGSSASLLKFLNMIENDERLIAVKGLRVNAGTRDRANPDQPPLHDIQVHLETYFYNPDSKNVQRIKIPGEEARLQEPEIRDAIAAFEPERPDSYILRPSTGRRDPMVDPRKVRPPVDPAELEKAWKEQEAIVVELEKRVDAIAEKSEQVDALIQVGDLFRSDHLSREIDQDLTNVVARIAQVDQMKKIVIPALIVRMETLQGRLEQLRGRRPAVAIKVTREVAERMLADMGKAFDGGTYNQVVTLGTEWANYIQGKQVDPEAKPACNLIAGMRTRARTFLEFQSIPLKVTGTIVNPIDPARSVALINGKPMHTGDKVDPKGDLVVGHISSDGVEVVYKGETIRVDRNGETAKPMATAGAPAKIGTPTEAAAVNVSLPVSKDLPIAQPETSHQR